MLPLLSEANAKEKTTLVQTEAISCNTEDHKLFKTIGVMHQDTS